MADKDPRVIGRRIARRRHQLDWSQVELAERLGVSPSTVANWERGASYPKKKLGKVEQVLGINLDDEPEPQPAIPPILVDQIRRTLPPEDQQRVIDAIEATLAGTTPPGETGEEEPSGPSRRAG